ncbi:2-keto-4-pentenoate hydratase/2-oxohepta-3-ene-1,7-dioic acid hydratase in catechol pathway [Aneurinibacillus soli]|uniref:Fumarylpyruvate hydrolase n=1 Tax=Aneurinibacillus soli TaxID=1500254 RepID=A0A0U4WM73_9BACL|nr:2-keto-4-pentenoate hydratase/2-oxohepta-3-ene-1,7-dioic acid hydratase in catechol pathway [Aneurinibacillus soli]BAU29451.1 Fumarylpyruvate hydrolase [Aneurinibacillus soli]
MIETIRNIYCVGRNYRLHAEELGNAVPTMPFLFGKPTHSLVEANGQEVILPGNRGEVHHEAELVLHIARPYEQGMRMEDVIDQVALGIDFTLRDVQSDLKKKSHPWLRAKGFPNAALLTKFRPFESVEACTAQNFSLRKNGETVQDGNIQDMLFDIPTIVAFTAEHFGLGKGDVIYTGTPAGVGPVADGDSLELVYGEEVWGNCTITLRS